MVVVDVASRSLTSTSTSSLLTDVSHGLTSSTSSLLTDTSRGLTSSTSSPLRDAEESATSGTATDAHDHALTDDLSATCTTTGSPVEVRRALFLVP